MTARLRSWWQKRSKPLIVAAIIILVVGVLALVILGYLLRLDWTGFFNKTLWDWLQLLIVPLALAVIALIFQFANSRTERQIAKQRYEQDQQFAKQRYEQDQQIALDKQREDLLQAYLDRMSELLIEKNLRSSQPDDEVRKVARVRTITILFQLDARRIGYVFAFLRDAGLLSTKPYESIVNFNQANLTGINLSHVDLRKVSFFEATLIGADFTEADLLGATLHRANLWKANLKGANFIHADLGGANLNEANLYGAKLIEAGLYGATLYKANLFAADFSDADLTEANLISAEGITIGELEKRAKSLERASMPDGSKHA